MPFFLLLISITSLRAARVDTIVTYSASMKKEIKAVIILPAGYDTGKAYPAVYLLHGYSGNYADWVTKTKGLDQYADQYKMIIVCPDGGFSSWYWDSPMDSSYRYETYISKELVQWIDGKYKTIRNRNGRAITGLSMGGHGALYLAIKHQDVFGAAGSMSGGVDIRPFPGKWEMAKWLGDYSQYKSNWEKNTVINLLNEIKPESLALIIDCGTGDFFFEVNKKLHEELLYRYISHDFITRPGVHDWKYWQNAVQYQLLFMSNFFRK